MCICHQWFSARFLWLVQSCVFCYRKLKAPNCQSPSRTENNLDSKCMSFICFKVFIRIIICSNICKNKTLLISENRRQKRKMVHKMLDLWPTNNCNIIEVFVCELICELINILLITNYTLLSKHIHSVNIYNDCKWAYFVNISLIIMIFYFVYLILYSN